VVVSRLVHCVDVLYIHKRCESDPSIPSPSELDVGDAGNDTDKFFVVRGRGRGGTEGDARATREGEAKHHGREECPVAGRNVDRDPN